MLYSLNTVFLLFFTLWSFPILHFSILSQFSHSCFQPPSITSSDWLKNGYGKVIACMVHSHMTKFTVLLWLPLFFYQLLLQYYIHLHFCWERCMDFVFQRIQICFGLHLKTISDFSSKPTPTKKTKTKWVAWLKVKDCSFNFLFINRNAVEFLLLILTCLSNISTSQRSGVTFITPESELTLFTCLFSVFLCYPLFQELLICQTVMWEWSSSLKKGWGQLLLWRS